MPTGRAARHSIRRQVIKGRAQRRLAATGKIDSHTSQDRTRTGQADVSVTRTAGLQAAALPVTCAFPKFLKHLELINVAEEPSSADAVGSRNNERGYTDLWRGPQLSLAHRFVASALLKSISCTGAIVHAACTHGPASRLLIRGKPASFHRLFTSTNGAGGSRA